MLVEPNKGLEEILLDTYTDRNLLHTVDIKIMKELSEGEDIEIQPDENESVIIKLEVPYTLKDKLFKVYHLKNSEVLDVSTEVTNYWTETSNNKLYVLFEAESFSNYVILYENQYKVTIKGTSGGTVTPNGTMNVSQGKDILLNLDAIEGYIIRDVVVNGVKHTTKRADSDTFLVENIFEDTVVTVNFTLKKNLVEGGGSGGSGGGSGGGGGGGSYQKPDPIVEQVPISPTHKAYMQGYNDGTFKPKGNITRAEVATILAKVSKDFDETKTYNVNFTDAENGRWYSNYVGYCYEKEILVGYKDGSFKPNENITRSEYAAAIARMTNVILLEGASKFADANNTWFEKYVYTLEKYNLVDGYPDGSFGSYDNITRAEATKMLNSILGRSPNKLKVQTQGYMTTEFSDVVLTSWYAYDVIEATNENIFDNHH